MKKAIFPLSLLTMAGAILIGAASSPSTGKPGKSLFLDNKCQQCHSVESLGITRNGEAPPGKLPPDLSGVGLRRTPDWISKWLMKEEKNTEGKKHLKKWKGSEEDLATISNWLATLKSK